MKRQLQRDKKKDGQKSADQENIVIDGKRVSERVERKRRK